MNYLFILITLVTAQAFALETGTTAPDFTLTGVESGKKEVKLSDLRGKVVVLEWLNHGCPFVRKHYDSGNMQALQKKYVKKNVIWLSIISSAPGKQGHVDRKGALKEKLEYKSIATDVLLDPEGKVGRLYEAKTTPHMFVIDKSGVLSYQGAIDDRPDTDQASILGAKNFVAEALEEILSGKPVTRGTTRAYGCGVKY